MGSQMIVIMLGLVLGLVLSTLFTILAWFRGLFLKRRKK